MQLHQLEYFVAIAETESFTAGAQRARVVQSTVSNAVRQLERELGCDLFVRRRKIHLTREGEVLLPRARDVLAAVEAAATAVAATRGQVSGTVRLGMMYRFAGFDLAGRLASFQRLYPHVVVRGRTSTEGTRGHVAAVRNGDLDLALIATGDTDDTVAGVRLRPLDGEAIRLVCSVDNLLARSGGVRLDQLTDEAFIDLPLGWGLRTVVDSAFAKAGLHRLVQIESVGFDLGQSLVREGLGVMFVPASAVLTDPRVVALDVEPALGWRTQLAWSVSRPLSAAAAALAAELELDAMESPRG